MAKRKALTYSDARAELAEILELLQSDGIPIDELSPKVKRAATLIQFCREQLRSTGTEIEQLLDPPA